MKKHYDVVVVGSGSGLKIADYAAKNGYKVALIDKGPFGGTCVNRGCIPSKMLIYPSDLVQAITSADKLNIETDRVKMHFSALVQREVETVDRLADRIQSHYQSAEMITVYPEKGVFIDEGTLQVGDHALTGDRFYLAIGARPRIPAIEGLSDTPYLTSTKALRCSKRPKKVVIIGGGFISAELAHFYSSAGAEVEVFARSSYLKKIDSELRDAFLNEFKKSHTVHEQTLVTKVSYENQLFTLSYQQKGSAPKTTQADTLVVATGRQSWADSIGIEHTSIQTTEAGFIQVDEFLKTKAPNIWALGDCVGRHPFRHMANFEADYLIRRLLDDEKAPLSYPPIPFAIFTHPQIGIVGKTEQELKKEEIPVFTGSTEYKKSDMGRARRSSHGLVKLVFHGDTKRLLSAHIMGDEAATMVHILIGFIQMNAQLEDLLDCIFIHPALPEIISSAAHDAKKKNESS